MGCSIKFVRLDDFIADIDVLDLSADGYSLADNGYSQVSAPIGAKSVSEVITLKLQGTSKDDLAAMTQEIDDKVRQVQWWLENQGVERYQVWLRVQLDNETYPRQAQILNIRPPDKVQVFTPLEIHSNYIGEYSIGIERTPYWEDPYPYPTTTPITSISIIGGTATLAESISGDVPARLAKLAMYPPDALNSLQDYWIGWKTNRFGVAANFIPVWPLEASNLTTDTTRVSDATAYNTYRLNCSFATNATLVKRAVLPMLNFIGSNYADQRGTYAVLLRAKMSDTTQAMARISYGFGSSISIYGAAYRSRCKISGTYWNLYEMGTVKIPSLRIYNSNTLENFAIGIDAERITGTGSGALHLDCLILIPVDDGMVKLSAVAGMVSLATRNMIVMQQADDILSAFVEDTNQIHQPVTPIATNYWSLPANSDQPIFVAAASYTDGDGNVKGRVTGMTYTYIPRWRTLRGSDTG